MFYWQKSSLFTQHHPLSPDADFHTQASPVAENGSHHVDACRGGRQLSSSGLSDLLPTGVV